MRSWNPSACMLAVVLTAPLAASFSAHAKEAAPRETCLTDSTAPDQRIAACTAVIRAHPLAAGSASGKAAKLSAAARTTVAALLKRADALGQKGDYRRAIADVTRIIARAPSAVAFYTRALAYHDSGNDARAIADCYAALKIDPNNANALFVRATSFQSLADYRDAIRDYGHVLRLQPNRIDALFSRGAARYSAGDYQHAVADFSRAIDRGAAEGTVFYLRGLAYRELGEDANARADMEEAVRRDPELQDKPPIAPAPRSHITVNERRWQT
jgi:tetratricopeptide (TPR) repeat protein